MNLENQQSNKWLNNLSGIKLQIQYPNQVSNSKINLISIEEPETFMHPQMQELFIKNINDAINALLEINSKKLNSQLILTTHSSHILNSKIHTGNSFNSINYITALDGYSNVVTLDDDKLTPKNNGEEVSSDVCDKKPIEQLKFLKKHIKYKVSEMFFSDAVIFVEGITEETLLRYYIDKNEKLNRFYISIFRIDGAHGLVYHNLIKLLKVPCLIITDLDIKRKDDEKGEKIKDWDDSNPIKVACYKQISTLDKRKTTNATIIKYNKSDDLSLIKESYVDENIFVTFQGAIEGYYATSFEEAYILTNYNNEVLASGLENTIPNIYKGIVGASMDKNNLKENSFKLQRKLSGSKSDFANNILYAIIEKDDSQVDPELPKYIEAGFNWLEKQIKKEVL